MWRQAEAQLQEALEACPYPWKINRGDGAFYGPKIDIKLFDALERSHQCGTIQLDFQLPLRFDLQYHTADSQHSSEEQANKTDSPPQTTPESKKADPTENFAVAPSGAKDLQINNPDGSLETPLKPGFARPIIIHRAILGSIERMAAVVLEHTGGQLPFWLSPRQAIVCPISDKFCKYADYVKSVLVHRGFDVDADLSNSTINKKIREASVSKWNYVLVVGGAEEESRTVMVRSFDNPKEQKQMDLPELIQMFEELRDINCRRQLSIPEYTPDPL